jgi:hypothetical protein
MDPDRDQPLTATAHTKTIFHADGGPDGRHVSDGRGRTADRDDGGDK